MRILFLHPQIRLDQPPLNPPYGILQLLAITDELGYKVECLDNNAFRLPLDAIRQEINSPHQAAIDQVKGEIEQLYKKFSNIPLDDKNGLATLQDEIQQREKKIGAGLLRSDQSWDVIGIGGLITQYKYVKELVPVCREKHPDAVIVGGGGFMTSMPREMMRWLPDLDIGVIGEAYNTWRDVLNHVDDENWKQVQGLIYRHGKNAKFSTMRPLIPEEELDEEIPWPAYEFSPVETYLMNSRIPYSPEAMSPNCRRLSVLTSYGCSMRCSFCFHNGSSPFCQSQIYNKKVTGKPFRQHSPKYIVNLIQHLRQTYCINFVSFLDENMTVNRKWFLEFCDLLAESGLATLINWGMVVHSRTVDGDLLRKAKDCGCTYISFGGETSSERLLKKMGKGQTKEQMSAAIQATQAAGINAIMSFIVGFPETTIDDLIGDLQFYIDNQIHVIPFFLQPYPGSKLYNEYKDKIIEQYLTDEEKLFLSDPTPMKLGLLVLEKSIKVDKLDEVTQSWIKKNFDTISYSLKDQALERWVSILDDAVQLTANLTKFDDVTLSGLRWLISTNMADLTPKWQDMKRLEKFKNA